MKIIHTADWHLGSTFYGYDRTAEHRHFLKWLLGTIQTEQADVLIIAGNIFDNPFPPAEAEGLLYDFFDKAISLNEKLQIILISGENDPSSRIKVLSGLFSRVNIYMKGMLEYNEKGKIAYDRLCIPLKNEKENILCLAIPFIRSTDIFETKDNYTILLKSFLKELAHYARKNVERGTPILLTTHLRNIITEPDFTDWLDGVTYTMLGGSQKQQLTKDRQKTIYSMPILPMAFEEKNLQFGVICMEISSDEKPQINEVVYSPLRKMISIPEKVSSLDHILNEIRSLDSKGKENIEEYSYLEIKMQEEDLSSIDRQSILKELDKKAIRFCRIVNDKEKHISTTSGFPESVKELKPLNVMRHLFQEYYNNEISASLEELMHKAEKNLNYNEN